MPAGPRTPEQGPNSSPKPAGERTYGNWFQGSGYDEDTSESEKLPVRHREEVMPLERRYVEGFAKVVEHHHEPER